MRLLGNSNNRCVIILNRSVFIYYLPIMCTIIRAGLETGPFYTIREPMSFKKRPLIFNFRPTRTRQIYII